MVSLLFSAIIIHNFLPDDVMRYELIPVVKDLGGNMTSSDNYRTIAIASIVSKCFELVLLKRMHAYLFE